MQFNNILHITQLHDESLVVSTYKNIKIFSIKNNVPQILQNLAYHKAQIYKTIELSNKINLISCSQDMEIIIWKRNNENEYEFDYKFYFYKTRFENILELKDNIIIASSGYDDNSGIIFLDIKNKTTLFNLKLNCSEWNQNMCLLNENKYLIVGGRKAIYLIDCTIFKIIYKININNWVWSLIKLNENEFITGGDDGNLTKWELNNNEIKKIYEKQSIHNDCINSILKLKNENIILTCSDDKNIKISEFNK
jgi:WD40 repeat protein